MALDTSNWTRDDLIREAKLQTDAIQRLNVWLRIGYSLLAVGFILGYWGFYGGGGTAFAVVGIVLLVVGAFVSVVLKVRDHQRQEEREEHPCRGGRRPGREGPEGQEGRGACERWAMTGANAASLRRSSRT